MVGGLVGQSAGTIQGTYAGVNVNTSADSPNPIVGAGGLVGYQLGVSSSALSIVKNSYATGSVTMPTSYSHAGGLTGYSQYASITDSYATGSVTATGGTELAGGLVGGSYLLSASNSYATGSVSAGTNSYVGGLVGDALVNTF